MLDDDMHATVIINLTQLSILQATIVPCLVTYAHLCNSSIQAIGVTNQLLLLLLDITVNEAKNLWLDRNCQQGQDPVAR